MDDTIKELVQHIMLNGILPKNDDTDKLLNKLSGGAFDVNNDNQQNELIKQLSQKFTVTQMFSVMDAPNLLQTLIFVLFFIRFGSELTRKKYKRRVNESIAVLQKKLAEPQWTITYFKDLATNLIF